MVLIRDGWFQISLFLDKPVAVYDLEITKTKIQDHLEIYLEYLHYTVHEYT